MTSDDTFTPGLDMGTGTGFEAIRLRLMGRSRLAVAEEHTAQHLGSGGVRVLATPQMVLLLEQAAVAAVDHLLPEGYRTVGIHLDVSHVAPTPVGFEVEATAELIGIDGRRLSFRVLVHEAPFEPIRGGELVGQGMHQRVIVSVERFGKRLSEKTTLREPI